MPYVSIPYIQVRSNSLIVYWLPAERQHRRHELKGLKTYSGKMTHDAKRRLTCALDLLIQKAEKKERDRVGDDGEERGILVVFVTLTIADRMLHDAKTSYEKLLKPWIRVMKSKAGMEDYVWKLELQKRGQIHYHVATTVYLDWRTVRSTWNGLQYRAGMLNDFGQRFGHYNPNGTDVHACRSINDTLEYLAKEVCKDVQNSKAVNGKVWDSSDNLKTGRYAPEMTNWNRDVLEDGVGMGFVDRVDSENCTIFKCKSGYRALDENQMLEYDEFLKQL